MEKFAQITKKPRPNVYNGIVTSPEIVSPNVGDGDNVDFTRLDRKKLREMVSFFDGIGGLDKIIVE